MQSFKTPANTGEALFEEKRSKFIAVCKSVQSEAQALEFLAQVKAANKAANHNCYAYILRENNITRYSDDGEPAKTAGLPILTLIQHKGLTNCIVVVTRYFGGTLLGTGGLVRAYTEAARLALLNAQEAVYKRCVILKFNTSYDKHDQVLKLFEKFAARFEKPQYGEQVNFEAVFIDGEQEKFISELGELTKAQPQVQQQGPLYLAV